jgi:hypothetical protein
MDTRDDDDDDSSLADNGAEADEKWRDMPTNTMSRRLTILVGAINLCRVEDMAIP